jgi:FAD/FMN-containing dehydrogenase
LRGGGGNFGVVTEFEFALHPLGELQNGRFIAPIDDATEALRVLAEIARNAPPELVLFAGGPAPEVPTVPGEPPSGPAAFVDISAIYQGTEADAEAAVSALRAVPNVMGGFETVSYAAIQASSGFIPFGLRHYWKGHFVRDLDDGTIEAVLRAMRERSGLFSFVLIEAISGNARREPAGGAAFGQREARWNVSALAIWEDPADDQLQIGWARRTADDLGKGSLTGAGYGNYAPVDETDERIRASFGPERYDRLRQVKRRYDPDNVFRFNHNIPPAD